MNRLLAVMLLCAVTIRVPGQPDKRPAQNQPNPTDHRQTTITFNNCEKSATQTEAANNGAPHWYTALKRPDWWLVIIAALTGLAIAYQAREMSLATAEMRKSAEAAKTSADALINSERPWIVIETQKIMASDHAGKAEFHIVAVNRGKSVARIISFPEPVEISCVLPDSELPTPYPSDLTESRPHRFLAPNATLEITDFCPRSNVNMQRMAVAGEKQGGNTAAQRMVIYGEIRYSDGVSPEPKWSRYCFQHNTEQFSNIGGTLMFCGPDGYNDYT